MAKCSRSCRYFDGHTRGGATADCRAKPAPTLRNIGLPGGGIASVSGSPETKAGAPCPYRGPYAYPRAWEPEHMVPPPPKSRAA